MNIFSYNFERKPKLSWFPFRPTNTLTLSMPNITPVLCAEVLPHDKWSIQSEIFARMLPLLAPIMAEVDVYLHYFYCPLRILTSDFDKFFNPNLQDEVFRPFIEPSKFVYLLQTEFSDVWDDIPVNKADRSIRQNLLMSYFSLFAESSLADYLGIPVFSWSDFSFEKSGTPGVFYYDPAEIAGYISRIRKFSAYPFMMYQLIYDEFYRDQSLEQSILERMEPDFDGFVKGRFNIDEPFDILSLGNWSDLMSLRQRAWQKDYFTSALPTPQSGPDVHLPLTGDAPVVLDPIGEGPVVYPNGEVRNPVTGNKQDSYFLGSPNGNLTAVDENGQTISAAVYDPNGSLKADMSEVTSATINELRRAVRAQEFLEKCARGGRRYIEMILSHFGVKSSDGRLDRPEFLGGGRQPFTITEVLSHVGEDDTQNFVLGEMGGHGISYGNTSRTRRFFEEHGFLFAFVSIIPKASYQQGLAKMWTRETIYDYPWPVFANLGEMEVKNYEIYAQADDPEGTFGYQMRYADLKYLPSTVHGAMRSSLSYWHLGRIFKSQPALNGEFVHPTAEECNRIFAVEDESEDKIVMIVKHHIKAKRPLPKAGIPTL